MRRMSFRNKILHQYLLYKEGVSGRQKCVQIVLQNYFAAKIRPGLRKSLVWRYSVASYAVLNIADLDPSFSWIALRKIF
jgi:hypothetical protein